MISCSTSSNNCLLIDLFTTIAQNRAPDHIPNNTSHNKKHSTIWLNIPFVGDLTTQLVKELSKRKLRRCLVDPNVDIRIKEKTTKFCFFTSNKDKTPPLSQSNVVYEFTRPVAILRTSAKRTELCLSAHKNMRYCDQNKHIQGLYSLPDIYIS